MDTTGVIAISIIAISLIYAIRIIAFGSSKIARNPLRFLLNISAGRAADLLQILMIVWGTGVFACFTFWLELFPHYWEVISLTGLCCAVAGLFWLFISKDCGNTCCDAPIIAASVDRLN